MYPVHLKQVTGSLHPLAFYMIIATEDNTMVEIFNGPNKLRDVQLNMFEVWSEDADELGPEGAFMDYTGLYISSDKPVSVMTGHGRVLFPNNNNYQYIFDSMPNSGEFETSYTTFPIGLGPETTGYILRVLAATDGTTVDIPDLGVSVTLAAGEYYELHHQTSYDSFKVGKLRHQAIQLLPMLWLLADAANYTEWSNT